MTTKTPQLCRHRTVQQGYVTLNGRQHYLGPWPTAWGKKPPPEVQVRYNELIARWFAGGRQLTSDPSPVTVNQVTLAYVQWAKTHYVPRRKKDDQNRFIRYAAAVVREHFGRTLAAEFGPKKLKAVRQAMIELDWSRNTINAQIDRVKRMFKWAVAEEMIPGEVYHALRSVDGLRRGSPGVRETQPVQPVSIATVEAVLPFLPPVVRAMVRVQLLTGMRPGELCQLRAADIDKDSADGVWLFRPRQHKTQHHGRDRVISIGPQAQEVLRPYIEAGEEYVFSPQAAEWARNAAPVLAALKTLVGDQQKLRDDLPKPGSPPETAKDKAAREAKVRADIKAVASDTKQLTTAEGQAKPTDPPSAFPAAVQACINGACFAGGTPLLTSEGTKPIEQFVVGDMVLSRSEFDPSGPVEAKVVEELFVTHGIVWHLHAGGQVIRTSGEHPFHVRDRGWVPCNQLRIGDLLVTRDGLDVRVDDLLDTGEWETLYNIRVADFHTYFVGCDEWGFGVWSHNIYTAIGKNVDLAKYNDRTDVDTWLKSGRIPGPNDPQVTWPENKEWIEFRYKRGDTFALVTDPSTLPPKIGGYVTDQPNGYFTTLELDYLMNTLGVSAFEILPWWSDNTLR